MGFFDYTGLIGRGIGTAIGAWFGGPMGAMAGGAVGEMEGGKIGAVGKGEADWSSLLSPGPAAPQQPVQASPLMLSSMAESALEGEALLGKSMANDDYENNNESSFRTPYALDQKSALGLGQQGATAQPSTMDNIGRALRGFGNVLSGTAAGYLGDNSFNLRLQQQMDQQMNAKAALEQRNRALDLEMFKSLGSIIEDVDLIKQYIPPEKHAEVAPKLAERYKRLGIPDEIISSMLTTGSGSHERVKSLYPLAELLDDSQKAQLGSLIRQKKFEAADKFIARVGEDFSLRAARENRVIPDIAANTLKPDERKRVSQVVTSNLIRLAQQSPEAKNLNEGELAEYVNNLDFLEDSDRDKLYSAGFKKVLSKEAGKEERAATLEIAKNERQAKAQEFSAEQQARAQVHSAQLQANAIEAAGERQAKALENQGVALIKARREAEQNAPLDTRATRWIHPETLQSASPDMTPIEAKEAGYAVITPSLSQAIPSARTALKTMDRFEELSKKLLVSTKDIGETEAITRIKVNHAKLKALEHAGNKDVGEFIGLQASLPTQVKAFGDTGNIAVKETEFAGKSLPNFSTDSRESALQKIDSRRKLLREVLKSSLSAASRTAEKEQNKDPLGLR